MAQRTGVWVAKSRRHTWYEGLDNGPQNVQKLYIGYLTWQRGLCECDYVKDLEMERRSCGPRREVEAGMMHLGDEETSKQGSLLHEESSLLNVW